MKDYSLSEAEKDKLRAFVCTLGCNNEDVESLVDALCEVSVSICQHDKRCKRSTNRDQLIESLEVLAENMTQNGIENYSWIKKSRNTKVPTLTIAQCL